MQHQSLADRVWWAWQCLERDDRGELPSWKSLEERHGLPNGSLYKLMWGITARPSYDTLIGVADALHTTAEWLRSERGESPVSRWPVMPRPSAPPGARKRQKRKSPSKIMRIR